MTSLYEAARELVARHVNERGHLRFSAGSLTTAIEDMVRRERMTVAREQQAAPSCRRGRLLVEMTAPQARLLVELIEHSRRPEHRGLVHGAGRRNLERVLRALHREIDPAPLSLIPEHPGNR